VYNNTDPNVSIFLVAPGPIIAYQSNVNGYCGSSTVQKIDEYGVIRCTDVSNDTSGIFCDMYVLG